MPADEGSVGRWWDRARLRGALTPKEKLLLNRGGSPGHVFGPVAGILRAVVANAFVPQRLRPLPFRQNREELLAVTGLIETGKLMPVVDRTYPLADTAEGLHHVEQGPCTRQDRNHRALRPAGAGGSIRRPGCVHANVPTQEHGGRPLGGTSGIDQLHLSNCADDRSGLSMVGVFRDRVGCIEGRIRKQAPAPEQRRLRVRCVWANVSLDSTDRDGSGGRND